MNNDSEEINKKIILVEQKKEIELVLKVITYCDQNQQNNRRQDLYGKFIQFFLQKNEINDGEIQVDNENQISVTKKQLKHIVIPSQEDIDFDKDVKLKTRQDGKSGKIIVYMIDKKDEQNYILISGSYQTLSEIPLGKKNELDEIKCGKLSYVYESSLERKKEQEELIVPIYMKYDRIKRKEYGNIMEKNQVTKNGELKCMDEVVLKNQSGVLLDILKQVTQSVMEGRGIVGVSLPVRIFQPISTIERIVDWWSFCPHFLPIASSPSIDPLHRISLVIAFAFSALHVSSSQQKPFNPLLGETYQAYFPQDNTLIYCEHTKHHPPITNFLLINHSHQFTFYGKYEYQANVSKTFNSIHFYQKGTSYVKFKDGTIIQWQLPFIKLGGVISGDRTIKYHGLMKFIDQTNQLKAIIKIGGNSKKEGGFMGFGGSQRQDIIKGNIYKYNKNHKQKVFSDQMKQDEYDQKMEDKIQDLKIIEGSWFENLIIGNQELWNINTLQPCPHIPIENPLPSDPRFREDLIWLTYNDQKQSQIWKQLLEERQRHEKRLREDKKKQIERKKQSN